MDHIRLVKHQERKQMVRQRVAAAQLANQISNSNNMSHDIEFDIGFAISNLKCELVNNDITFRLEVINSIWQWKGNIFIGSLTKHDIYINKIYAMHNNKLSMHTITIHYNINKNDKTLDNGSITTIKKNDDITGTYNNIGCGGQDYGDIPARLININIS